MNPGKPAQPLSKAECRSAAHKALLCRRLLHPWGSRWHPCQRSFLKPESSFAFDVHRVFCNLQNRLQCFVDECSTVFKGIGAGPVYETSLAWMPTRATGVKQAFTKR